MTTIPDNIVDMPGVNVLLMGMPGGGKTHSIRTLVDAGLEVFVLFTEPGMEVLGDIPSDKLHWHYVRPAKVSWDAMLDLGKKVNTMDATALQKMPNIQGKQYTQAMELMESMKNFVCDRTGEDYGDVTEWGTDRVLVLDSLSGLNIMVMDLVVGSKPVKTLQDWQVALDLEQRLINTLTLGCSCHFVLTAHLDKQVDEVMGGIKTYPLALGRKLGPNLGQFFSDVILCEKRTDGWVWSTQSGNIDLKARNIEWKDGQSPTFKTLIDNWKTRKEI